MKTIDLIISAYNEESLILRALDSLMVQKLPINYRLKVIVVCNACTDRTYEITQDYFNRHKNKDIETLVINTKVRGKPNAMNMGMTESDSETVIFMDADCHIDTKAIVNLHDKLNNGYRVAGGLICADFSRHDKSTLLYKYQRILDIHNQLFNRFPVGRLMGFNRELIDKFPEDVGSEDTWLSLTSVQKYGSDSICIDQNSRVYYFPSQNWIEFITQESRFMQMTSRLINQYPELGIILEKFATQKVPFEKKAKKIYNLLTPEEIKMEEIILAKELLLPIIKENSQLMSLVKENGLWEPTISSK